MEYHGRYQTFDPNKIRTYPISARENKVQLEDLVDPMNIGEFRFDVAPEVDENLKLLAGHLVRSRKDNLPVILFSGAHLIKNGLGLLLADLVEKDLVTCVAGNMATSIHDFELAMIGQTSEYVPQALEKGQFGMAYEFAYINTAMNIGNRYHLGLGESLGKMIMDEEFRQEVFRVIWKAGSPDSFLYPDKSVLAACHKKNIPFTVHAGIGTDVTDQHPSFDGSAKGGCSGRDFLIYTHEIEKLAAGGMVFNIGSAVTGPEVFLKAASMTGNIGKVPRQIITADFDIRPFNPAHITNESQTGYYFRDQKSIVVRVPEAYGGKGYYVEGNQKQTFPLFYKYVTEKLNA
ncbi:MAG: hypothetical protein MI975_03350 [Cytophagales bacterium]|nr:hypothetical protein [Cytophagales bacterium]